MARGGRRIRLDVTIVTIGSISHAQRVAVERKTSHVNTVTNVFLEYTIDAYTNVLASDMMLSYLSSKLSISFLV